MKCKIEKDGICQHDQQECDEQCFMHLKRAGEKCDNYIPEYLTCRLDCIACFADCYRHHRE